MNQKNNITLFLEHFRTNGFVEKVIEWAKNPSSEKKLHLKNPQGSTQSLLLAILNQEISNNILVVAENKKIANYLLTDLEQFLPKDQVLFFPESHKIPYETELVDNANVVLRTEVLNQINKKEKNSIVVTFPKALFEKVVSKQVLEKNTVKLSLGERVDSNFINETLFHYGFQCVDFVTQPGEFSVRGGIVDLFSYSAKKPYRISFFDDEIESIRIFDIETQLSIEKVNQIEIIANIENKEIQETRQSLLDYILPNTLLYFQNIDETKNQWKEQFELAAQSHKNKNESVIKPLCPEELFINEKEIKKTHAFSVIDASPISFYDGAKSIQINHSPQPSFNNQLNLLADDLVNYSDLGYQNYIFCNSEKQVHRFAEIFEGLQKKVLFTPILGTLHEGFIDQDKKILCYTDHQIFGRQHKFTPRNDFAKSESLTLKELTDLQVGDFVTHIDFGIGQFAGLKKIEVNNKWQEAIKLIYLNNDILYVNIHSLHKIAKYSSKDSKPPKITKLGSPTWKALKNKTKQRLKEIAFDLIQLYAKRKTEKSFAFSSDNYLQIELESSFIYEDTPDQIKATLDVKADMETDKPMDRLICGDVGFGKTEVAIRAAFKAATDGKQVVILVPTTLLAFQHFRSFSARLKEFPVRVDYLNRFRSTKDRTQIIKDLEQGKIDIIIGTHQLVNQKIQYKDLGLLIVDEEHKFGVSVKEKLKDLKSSLDTLTLTATPIPRTLQFSLMGARDLSVIKTPPPNRQPIETSLIGFNEEKIRDAVFFEMQRGGQVYFVNNRIENLSQIAGMIQRLVPEAKIAFAHGQMEGKKTENIFLDFIDRKFDVLVSTTIIESGLDVATANTIFINDAQNFGLADLHQMRGRVGRSNKKAYCYLITPSLSLLTSEAKKRLKALEDFSDLGSGFLIAMKDLEIRGAGDLLGAEQSGFINEMGFETYQKILNEAVQELNQNNSIEKDNSTHNKNELGFIHTHTKEIQIDTDLEILLPHTYINNVRERFSVYTQLSEIETKEEVEKLKNNLIDRFGTFPFEAEELFKSVELKFLGKAIGFEKIIIKETVMLGYFASNPQSPYFQTKTFVDLLQFINQNNYATFKEKKSHNNSVPNQLFLRFEKIHSIDLAYNKLLKIVNSIQTNT
jgi:transcription-repair coupling factor (superfamily II helicase)